MPKSISEEIGVTTMECVRGSIIKEMSTLKTLILLRDTSVSEPKNLLVQLVVSESPIIMESTAAYARSSKVKYVLAMVSEMTASQVQVNDTEILLIYCQKITERKLLLIQAITKKTLSNHLA
jgi:hypothetical protein